MLPIGKKDRRPADLKRSQFSLLGHQERLLWDRQRLLSRAEAKQVGYPKEEIDKYFGKDDADGRNAD